MSAKVIPMVEGMQRMSRILAITADVARREERLRIAEQLLTMARHWADAAALAARERRWEAAHKCEGRALALGEVAEQLTEEEPIR